MSNILFCDLRWPKSKLATKIFVSLDWVSEAKIVILADGYSCRTREYKLLSNGEN